MRSFSITTLGCKVNQYDGAALAQSLCAAGLVRRDPPSPRRRAAAPDLVVVNTCCVTAAAMQKSRYEIRRALRRFPGARLLVTGCYGDYQPEKLAGLLAEQGVPAGQALIAGHHGDLAAVLDRLLRQPAAACSAWAISQSPCTSDACRIDKSDPVQSLRHRRLDALRRHAPGTSTLGTIREFPGHQRAFVKIQDGCDAFCSYCVVPYTRPLVRWRDPEAVLDECRHLVARGHREIVLCGVYLGAYGRKTALRRKWNHSPSLLPELVRRLGEIEGLWRIRLSSLEPLDLDDALLEACRASGHIAPHFHLPLQSGSAAILKAMNRQYTPADFRRVADRLRDCFDRPALTTDIIVGFPGESDEDFAATLELASDCAFAEIHAFPFSAIEGTAAWERRRHAPPPPLVRRRLAQLQTLRRDLARQYRAPFVGELVEGVFESPPPRSRCAVALTDRHVTLRVKPPLKPAVPSARGAAGAVAKFRVTAVTDDGADAQLVELLYPPRKA